MCKILGANDKNMIRNKSCKTNELDALYVANQQYANRIGF